jgi:hypothetical protein
LDRIAGASQGLTALQNRIDQSTMIDQYIAQRQQKLSQYVTRFTQVPAGVGQAFTRLKKTGYYYRQQISDWKASLSDPGRLEQKTLATLAQLPSYQQFMAKHSMLASMFALPSGYGDSSALAGLQTKDLIERQLHGLPGSGSAALSAQMQQAYGQLQRMQDNVSRWGGAGQQVDMPDFKPNTQATKSLLRRLTYGLNLQVTSSRNYMPATGVIGGQLGYKLDDKKVIGIGFAYHLGVSGTIGHLHFSGQGVSLRSYGEVRIKNSWYGAGGYEVNYFSAFAWQPSALLGIEKKYRLSSKMQGSLQIFFDLLYRQQTPYGQPFKFRTGYSFK